MPIVNGKNNIAGWNALSQPKFEFKLFETFDQIVFFLEKRQLIVKLPFADGILPSEFPQLMVG